MVPTQHHTQPRHEAASDVWQTLPGHWAMYLYNREHKFRSVSLQFREELQFTGSVRRGPDHLGGTEALYDFQSRPLHCHRSGIVLGWRSSVSLSGAQLRAVAAEGRAAIALVEESLASGYGFSPDGGARAFFEAVRETYKQVQEALETE